MNDGGSAFPVTGDRGAIDGMSLLDWFAGQALAEMAHPDVGCVPAKTAEAAYKVAAAMLAEREKGDV